MSESVLLHVVAPSDERRERITGALSGLEPALHDSVDEFRRAADGERCAVVVDVDGGVGCRELIRICGHVADREREWVVLVPTEGEGGLSLRPVSAGFALETDRVGPVLSGAGEDGVVFDLHEVLRFVARIRHDINNPLTAGLAETQLLLMDRDRAGEDELGESLETIQRQLQRIQSLVEDLTRLRRPDREVG